MAILRGGNLIRPKAHQMCFQPKEVNLTLQLKTSILIF